MFEIIIFCVILLAVSYWAVLWLMGRREDVLHGEFVEAGAQAEEPVRPVIPDRPAQRAVRPLFPKKPIVTEKPVQTAIAELAAQAALPAQPAFRPERLESLLNSIKQDLHQLVQK
ncbi:hypothetical protein [Bradyrhizobium sp. AUGA SZCCT0182]|uniref:hypothetical protein n=1 Tax=Bradyrhizobium sp. AUGA SZCCT0182 TaxID=2807667 RepID=UPI001BA75266|nr:hypothetical protein [Bradyrhizobium sp. AUGA SZCCT0182]MBR1233335.1 hypothetical protein [Bradyrhizobium sp. AUGA SZCCT0182]